MINEVMEIITKALAKERDATLELVEAIIDSEQFYHFTNDDEYLNERQDIVVGAGQGGPGQPGQPGGPGQMGGQPGQNQQHMQPPQNQND